MKQTMSAHNPYLWQEAASFAAAMHQGQFRKDGRTPYFAHPVRVAMTVRDVFECHDQQALAAALLHDCIEDTTADYDDVLERFGVVVADVVATLTKDMRLREDVREESYDAALLAGDWRARLIKLADVHDNLCDLSSADKLPTVLSRCRRAVDIALKAGDDTPSILTAIGKVEALMALRSGAGA
ncbi:MAG: HD domain-containing protein [Phycisphaeraceae bacterium]|nr:HD domain-containing protein [Phycisphaeraceae bacterium]MCB9847764.1 HD domain-containing protein [Phycisphaeraceae bacterium]